MACVQVQGDHTPAARRLAFMCAAVMHFEHPGELGEIRLQAAADRSVPQQTNCVDCGMFAMKAMDFLSRPDRTYFPEFPEGSSAWESGTHFPWQQEEMDDHRRTFFHQILSVRIDL